ncbi:zinc finger protein 84-like isoform X1 [Schistocerca americana]|uniref:zinc finger protein 84-like isoform X1 n=1 Tax=Schistocerca americana TaxID=7009 RepID=UPI001F4F3972|nr:zinc finger protein 84-like isoform X1 [Schistocerca americana]
MEKICRLCMSRAEDLISIFETTDEFDRTVANKISACVAIEAMEGDGLPSEICKECASLLDVMYNFKEKCRASDWTLRKLKARATHHRQFVGPVYKLMNETNPDVNLDARLAKNLIGYHNAAPAEGPETFLVQKGPEVIAITVIDPNAPGDCTKSNTSGGWTDPMKPHDMQSSVDGRSLYGGTPGSSSPDLAEGAPILFVNEGIDSDGQLVTEFEPVSAFHPEALRRRLERDLPKSENDMQPASKSETDTQPASESETDMQSAAEQRSEQRNSAVHMCRECKEPFGTEEEMINHLKTHYSCIDCGQTFTEVDELTEHCKMLCAAEPWSCKTCGMTFSSKDKLHSHLQVHTEKPYICDECPSSFSRKDVLARHKAIHSGRQFIHVCDECSRVFTREEDINLHKLTHSFCKDCGVQFASSQELSAHKLSCPNVKPWPCDLCDKSFVSKDRLNRHLKIHSSDKPYVCEICSAAFNRRDKLTRHKTTHSGDRPYQCEYCDLSFTRRDKLGRHMTTHFKSQVNNEENFS